MAATTRSRMSRGATPRGDWKGKARSNDTHARTPDPDERHYRKSPNTASLLDCQGHVLKQNRSGLTVGALVTHADEFGERAAALVILDAMPGAGLPYGRGGLDVRLEGLRGRPQGPGRHVAHGPERRQPLAQRDRRAHDTIRGQSGQPERTKAIRGTLRLGQDGRAHSPDGLPRHQARLSAPQAHDHFLEPDPNGSNVAHGAARGDAMRAIEAAGGATTDSTEPDRTI